MKETWGTWFYRRPTNPPNHLREWLGGIDSIEIVNLKIPWGLWFYRCIFRKRVRAPTLSVNSKGDISAILWPMGFSRFPRKKRSIGLRCRPPHACIHLEKFMYPLALVSGAPHKAYIFRFNTPTNNTFPASGTHTCLILRGYPPLVPIHFWQKVRGLTPPLCSYIIRNVGSTPPTPEPVGAGDCLTPHLWKPPPYAVLPSVWCRKRCWFHRKHQDFSPDSKFLPGLFYLGSSAPKTGLRYLKLFFFM